MGEIRHLVATNLRNVCKAKGVKQADIARLLGVSSGNVSNWFNGTNAMDIDKLAIICKYLGVSLDFIFGYADVNAILTDAEKDIINKYRLLESDGRQQLTSYLDYLVFSTQAKEKNDVGAI